jgi:hypothetical protein
LQTLRQVTVGIADFPGPWLGMAFPGAVWIDQDAAGYGWYTGASPASAAAFPAGPGSAAAGKMDLLTVVAHELGHELGLADNSGDGLMGVFLLPGVRRLPVPEEAPATSPAVGSAFRVGSGSLTGLPLPNAGLELNSLVGSPPAPRAGTSALAAGLAPGRFVKPVPLASAAPVWRPLEKRSGDAAVTGPTGLEGLDRLSALDAAFAMDPDSLLPAAG